MTAFLAVLAFLVAITVVFAGVEVAQIRHRPPAPSRERRPRSWLERHLRRTVTLHTVDDQTFEGVLERVTDDGVVLIAARLLRAGDSPVEMGGRVYIPRPKVAIVQMHEGLAGLAGGQHDQRAG